MGWGYAALHALYPRLVYASISGFGQTGPDAQRPAYDVLIQAMGGLASITGQPDGPPVRVGSSIADLSAALFGAIGILAALERARRTGEGQQVDISMLDCQVALLENALARYAVAGEVPKPLGSRHPAITPFQFFAACDGYIVIAAGNDRLWRQLCAALGLGALADDPRFANNALRTEHHAALEPALERVLAEKTVDEWCAILAAAGVPRRAVARCGAGLWRRAGGGAGDDRRAGASGRRPADSGQFAAAVFRDAGRVARASALVGAAHRGGLERRLGADGRGDGGVAGRGSDMMRQMALVGRRCGA